MSYNTMVFQVDSGKIAALWGSNNNAFLEGFMVKHKDDIEEGMDWHEVGLEVYRNCLADIINGVITADKAHHFIYGYLYEMLCRDFGEQIEREEFLSYLSEVTDGDFKVFIPIPAPENWPDIYSVKVDELAKARDLFLNNAPDYVATTDYVDEVNYLFKTAFDNKQGLVFINY